MPNTTTPSCINNLHTCCAVLQERAEECQEMISRQTAKLLDDRWVGGRVGATGEMAMLANQEQITARQQLMWL